MGNFPILNSLIFCGQIGNRPFVGGVNFRKGRKTADA